MIKLKVKAHMNLIIRAIKKLTIETINQHSKSLIECHTQKYLPKLFCHKNFVFISERNSSNTKKNQENSST